MLSEKEFKEMAGGSDQKDGMKEIDKQIDRNI